MKFATKPIPRYPTHLRHVATLPWEIKNSNFVQTISRYGRKCKQIAFIPSNFVIHPQILIFSVFKISSFSPYRLQVNFFMSLFFYLFTFTINSWHRKFVTADVTGVCVSTRPRSESESELQRARIFQGQSEKNNERVIASEISSSPCFKKIILQFTIKHVTEVQLIIIRGRCSLVSFIFTK